VVGQQRYSSPIFNRDSNQQPFVFVLVTQIE
jgi:hypothetical protein